MGTSADFTSCDTAGTANTRSASTCVEALSTRGSRTAHLNMRSAGTAANLVTDHLTVQHAASTLTVLTRSGSTDTFSRTESKTSTLSKSHSTTWTKKFRMPQKRLQTRVTFLSAIAMLMEVTYRMTDLTMTWTIECRQSRQHDLTCNITVSLVNTYHVFSKHECIKDQTKIRSKS